MLSVVMLNVVMLNVVMLNVVMLNVVMLNVVAPYEVKKKLFFLKRSSRCLLSSSPLSKVKKLFWP